MFLVLGQGPKVEESCDIACKLQHAGQRRLSCIAALRASFPAVARASTASPGCVDRWPLSGEADACAAAACTPHRLCFVHAAGPNTGLQCRRQKTHAGLWSRRVLRGCPRAVPTTHAGSLQFAQHLPAKAARETAATRREMQACRADRAERRPVGVQDHAATKARTHP